jgi:hypothetical protein
MEPMSTRLRSALLIAAAGLGVAAVVAPWQRPPAPPLSVASEQRLQDAIPDSAWGALIGRISEPGGYFDTDNLISNESSYLHVLGKLDGMRLRGGAYIGVGPEQNFSYMAVVRPSIAFIIDIRRDNLLEHLMFKALFEEAPTRVEYLALLFGRPAPADAATWQDRAVTDLVQFLDQTPPDRKRFDEAQRRVLANVRSSGIALSDEDVATVGRIHATFYNSAFGNPSAR